MNTRFDTMYWTTARGDVLSVKEMGTEHLMNTLNIFSRRPTAVISMLIRDIEASAAACSCVPWTKENQQGVVTQSIHSVTSMTAEEACMYALNSCLGQAMQTELTSRGVNINNYFDLLKSVG